MSDESKISISVSFGEVLCCSMKCCPSGKERPSFLLRTSLTSVQLTARDSEGLCGFSYGTEPQRPSTFKVIVKYCRKSSGDLHVLYLLSLIL